MRPNLPWCAASLILAASLLFPACDLDGANRVQTSNGGDSTRGPTTRTALRPPTIFDLPLRRLTVEFNVMRISAPKGAFTTDATVWSLVRGPLPDAGAALRLQDNGFRAAVGRDSDRAPLKAALEKIADPRTAMDHAMPNESRLVDLDLGACPPSMNLFLFDPSGRMHGRHFDNARARFRLSYEIRSTNLAEVWIELLPELEEPPGPERWVMKPEGPRLEPEQRRHAFQDLLFSATIPEGGFLLLGPAAEVHAQPLLARPFFIEPDPAGGDNSRESVYVISPIIRSGEARGEGR